MTSKRFFLFVFGLGVTTATLYGCDRGVPTSRPTAATTPQVQEQLASIWSLLGQGTPGSFQQAVVELSKLPIEDLEAARYSVEGEAQTLDTLRLGHTTVRLDGEWMKRTLANFVNLANSSPAHEVRQAYERLDALLRGVMHSAKNWSARRQPGGQVPLAYGFAVDLRKLLARAILETKAVAADDEYRQAIQQRRNRLLKVDSLTRISSEVPP